MHDCRSCAVRNRAICAGLSDDELALLSSISNRHTFHRGQDIIGEGTDSVVVANVISGIVQLNASMADGRVQIVGMAFPADFIGRPYFGSAKFGVSALSDTVEVCLFTRGHFDHFARTHPDLEHRLLEQTLTELDRAREWMLLLGQMTAGERIAKLLLELSTRLEPSGCTLHPPLSTFVLPLDRRQMGELLGLTIETVSRQMTKLKQDGLIELPDRRTVVIRDRQALAELAMIDTQTSAFG